MAHVRSAILCDFAQVREGLLFISSGGITRVASPGIDAPVQFFIAGEIEVPAGSAGGDHEVTFKVTAVETSTLIWEATLSLSTSPTPDGLFAGEPLNVPFAFPVGPFPTTSFGAHDLKINIDHAETELITFYVLPIEPAA